MDAQARATRHETTAEAPVAVVIAPPWLQSGTGRIIEDQIAYYRDRGFATAFVGVAVHPAHNLRNGMWQEMAVAARALHADHVAFAAPRAIASADTLWRRARQRIDARTALDWIVEIGRCSRPPSALLNYLRPREIALFHVNHVFTMGFAHRLRRKLGLSRRTVPLLIETHDVQSLVLSDRGETNPWTGLVENPDSLLRSECRILGEADVLVHCSVDDQRFFTGRFPDKPQFLVRPVIDAAFVAAVARARRSQAAAIDVLLVGVGYDANATAVEWFLTSVWPLIAERGLVVKIVGRVESFLRERRPELCDRFKDFFEGPVADLVPYYGATRCVIAPMRSGRGISIKTLEAFALGIPFVGTAKAYRGIPAEPLARHGVRSYDDPRDFADALLAVLSSGAGAGTGARGRAVYEELCSRDACYAVRDEAVGIARQLHGPRGGLSAPPKSVPGPADAGNLDMLVLGTSNCIGSGSFIEKAAARSAVRLRNLSIGASSSTLGVYAIHRAEPVRRGVAFIDFAINDNDFGWNLWGRAHAGRIISGNITTIAARLRSMHYLPIVLVCASDLDQESEPLGHALHREACVKERINFIDLRRMVLGAIAQGVPRENLMRDDCHLSDRAGDAVADFVAAVIRRMNATTPALVRRSASIVRSRAVYAGEMFAPSALVERDSSLRSAAYGRLVMGDVVRIAMRPDERLNGALINIGGKGGTVALRNGVRDIVKSMTAYWSPENPDWYCAMFVDLAQPLSVGSAGVTMEIVGRDAVPTERTIHAKPALPGRYGEIEIEGVLLTERDTVEFAHTSPAYDWMPLDLSALPEAEQLAGRLAGLSGERDVAADH